MCLQGKADGAAKRHCEELKIKWTSVINERGQFTESRLVGGGTVSKKLKLRLSQGKQGVMVQTKRAFPQEFLKQGEEERNCRPGEMGWNVNRATPTLNCCIASIFFQNGIFFGNLTLMWLEKGDDCRPGQGCHWQGEQKVVKIKFQWKGPKKSVQCHSICFSLVSSHTRDNFGSPKLCGRCSDCCYFPCIVHPCWELEKCWPLEPKTVISLVCEGRAGKGCEGGEHSFRLSPHTVNYLSYQSLKAVQM